MTNNNRKKWGKKIAIIGVLVAIATLVITVIIWIYPNPAPSPNFSISVNPMQGAVQQTGLTQTTINVKGLDGYKYPVSLRASNQPSEMLINFIPKSGVSSNGFTSTMSINVGANLPANDYIITINGTGSDGKEHSCKYTLTVIPNRIVNESTQPPTEPYMIYSDIGIASGDIQVWSGVKWGMEPPVLVNGNYLLDDAPEGKKCFAVTSGSGKGNYVGWGVFHGIFENHILISPQTINLSDYENLQFWVKTPVSLKVDIQEKDPNSRKSSSVFISYYGWESSLADNWQMITIPRNSFRNVDLSQIFCPFMITGNGDNITFYIDDVKWIP